MNLQNKKPVRLIVSDVDGTLVNTKKSITDENIAAITLAMEQGVRVAIASGRAWNEMDEIFEKIPDLRYFICSNGALVMDKQDNRQLYRDGFSKQQGLNLLERLLEYGVYTEAYMGDAIYGTGESLPRVNHYIRENIRSFVLETRTFVPNLHTYMNQFDRGPEKLQVFYGDETMKERILQELSNNSDYDLLLSSEGNLEFVLPHTTKGNAVKELGAHWGIGADQIMTIGDAHNDVSMLQFADISIAMANADDFVKDSANYITKDNDSNGVAYAIYQVLERNKQFN